MNFVPKSFSSSTNENKFFNDFKHKFCIEKIDENHSYSHGSKHPSIIKVGSNDIGCIALQGLNNSGSPTIRITYLFIYEQKIGSGSLVLSTLCELADKYDVCLELDAIPQKRTKDSISRKKLISWYQRFGFNIEIQGDYFMRRYVQTHR
ncbi:hypothetical protein [Methylomonas sp. ZR1]|uniref:hypothetical protein n=1 Tax=Methylomonas sp. ZR1 TaxID=1797072 RepID=UPI001490CEDA|nr:hypothetical protein [Methylomonas sp. ZR1]